MRRFFEVKNISFDDRTKKKMNMFFKITIVCRRCNMPTSLSRFLIIIITFIICIIIVIIMHLMRFRRSWDVL